MQASTSIMTNINKKGTPSSTMPYDDKESSRGIIQEEGLNIEITQENVQFRPKPPPKPQIDLIRYSIQNMVAGGATKGIFF